MLFNKKVTKDELGELRAIHQLIKEQTFLYECVSQNTFKVKKGLAWCEQQLGILELLKMKENEVVSIVARKYGFKEGVFITVDLVTGIITPKKPLAKVLSKPIDVPKDLGEEKK